MIFFYKGILSLNICYLLISLIGDNRSYIIHDKYVQRASAWHAIPDRCNGDFGFTQIHRISNKSVVFRFKDHLNPIKKCVGPDSNRRTPARRDPKSRSFDLTRIPTPCKEALFGFHAMVNQQDNPAWSPPRAYYVGAVKI